MIRITASLMLLACLAQAANADDKPGTARPPASAALCQPDCSAAREECRAQAQYAADDDSRPQIAVNRNINAYVAAATEVHARSPQLRPTEAQAFRARRADHLQACEAQYRRCSSACRP